MSTASDLEVSQTGHVAHIVLSRPPHNHVDMDVVRRLADTLDALGADTACRAIVLSSGADAFCAGADFGAALHAPATEIDPTPFYAQAMRLFRGRKPLVAAIEGPAIGAGLGLALVADFRVACVEARFSANFNRLGFHPGFGLSLTLPRLIGEQQASLMFYTGRRIDGAAAQAMGLIDLLVDQPQVLAAALALAQEIATSAPLAVESTRATLREGLANAVLQANQRECAIQRSEFTTDDFREGVTAMAARRAPVFRGR